jgi:hypothetical protein
MIRAVHDVAAFDKNDSELTVALFAENGTVKDAVGSQVNKGDAALFGARNRWRLSPEGTARPSSAEEYPRRTPC